MTLRERIALAAFAAGAVVGVVGAVGVAGWPGGCLFASFVLTWAGVLLGQGDTGAAEPDGFPAPVGAPEDGEEWRMYEVRGDDDAGQGPGGAARGVS